MDQLNPHFERAWMLIQRADYERAEQELRQGLLTEPENGRFHALLALCHTHRERHVDANQESEAAISLAPDDDFCHYVRSIVLTNANCLSEAIEAVQHAIGLNTDAPHHYAQLALVLFRQRRWSDALAAADHGLQLDPEHDGCTNLRTMALVKLGRREAAVESLQGALARDPDDAWTHANMGWTMIEKANYERALEHFREALRLDPGMDYARQGIVTAMKARYVLYRPILSYFLWVQKLSQRFSWGLFIGAYLVFRVLSNLKDRNPQWSGWITPLIILYVAFALTSWLADPLFNLVLRLNRFGRLALDDEARRTSTLVGVCVAVAIACVALYFVLDHWLFLYCALVWMLAVLPLSLIYRAEKGWPRWSVLAMAVGLMAMGSSPLLLLGLENRAPEPVVALLALMTGLSLKYLPIAAIGSQIASQVIVGRNPRRVVLRRI